MVAMFPTPTVEDSDNNGGPAQYSRNSLPLNAIVGGALNPTWVEWLMGFPCGWTDLGDSGTQSYLESRKRSGGASSPSTNRKRYMAKPQDCTCGCGGQTRGGRFLPGHDAQLKSRLVTAAREGNKGDRAKAVKRLEELGWEKYIHEPVA
jgi:hypothetical protein